MRYSGIVLELLIMHDCMNQRAFLRNVISLLIFVRDAAAHSGIRIAIIKIFMIDVESSPGYIIYIEELQITRGTSGGPFSITYTV